nr:MAG TPA: hypothetical protein [Caudoviricetes sp.]
MTSGHSSNTYQPHPTSTPTSTQPPPKLQPG